MPFSKTQNNKKIALIMGVILAIAGVLSLSTNVLAQDKTPENKTGLEHVIKGTENWGSSKNISVKKFLANIGKSTGIYKMIHQETAEEIAAEKAEKEREETAMAANTFGDTKAPGWQ